jgi:hypothetical protein
MGDIFPGKGLLSVVRPHRMQVAKSEEQLRL